MLDYDQEAVRYDRTRGGVPWARAAAHAVLDLLPTRQGRLVDFAGGTGSVSGELSAAGLDVIVLDRSLGMLDVARSRLPGRVLGADATTVGKSAALGWPGHDTDRRGDVLGLAEASGLRLAGETSYVGHGQSNASGVEPVYPLVLLTRLGPAGRPTALQGPR